MQREDCKGHSYIGLSNAKNLWAYCLQERHIINCSLRIYLWVYEILSDPKSWSRYLFTVLWKYWFCRVEFEDDMHLQYLKSLRYSTNNSTVKPIFLEYSKVFLQQWSNGQSYLDRLQNSIINLFRRQSLRKILFLNKLIVFKYNNR